MIQRIYIDTSVLGGLFDIEFSDDTKPFFDRVEKGELKIVYSEITNDELANAPDRVRNYLKGLSSKQKEFVGITQELSTLPTPISGRRLLERQVEPTVFTLPWQQFIRSTSW